MIMYINEKQPEREKLTEEFIDEFLKEELK